MAPRNEGQGQALAERVADAAASTAGPSADPTIMDMVRAQETAIQKALPGAVSAQRFLRIAITQLRMNPGLQQCSAASVLGAIMQSAQLGLEFGPLGLAYLVPYKRECQLIIGYKGYCELARRSGGVKDIVARPIHEHDEWDYWEDESGDHMIHRRPRFGTERGELIGFYARAVYTNGGATITVASMDEIEKRRARSASADSSYSPWKTDFEAMCAKTAVRMMVPWLPLTTEVAQGIAADEHVVQLRGEHLVIQQEGGQESPALPVATEPDLADGRDATAGAEGAQEPPEAPQGGGRRRRAQEAPTEPPTGAQEPPPGDGDAPPPDDAEGQPGASGPVQDPDERQRIADDTMKKINTWSLDVVERVCREQGVDTAGGEKTVRARLYQHLAARRLEGDAAVEGLF